MDQKWEFESWKRKSENKKIEFEIRMGNLGAKKENYDQKMGNVGRKKKNSAPKRRNWVLIRKFGTKNGEFGPKPQKFGN